MDNGSGSRDGASASGGFAGGKLEDMRLQFGAGSLELFFFCMELANGASLGRAGECLRISWVMISTKRCMNALAPVALGGGARPAAR